MIRQVVSNKKPVARSFKSVQCKSHFGLVSYLCAAETFFWDLDSLMPILSRISDDISKEQILCALNVNKNRRQQVCVFGVNGSSLKHQKVDVVSTMELVHILYAFADDTPPCAYVAGAFKVDVVSIEAEYHAKRLKENMLSAYHDVFKELNKEYDRKLYNSRTYKG